MQLFSFGKQNFQKMCSPTSDTINRTFRIWGGGGGSSPTCICYVSRKVICYDRADLAIRFNLPKGTRRNIIKQEDRSYRKKIKIKSSVSLLFGNVNIKMYNCFKSEQVWDIVGFLSVLGSPEKNGAKTEATFSAFCSFLPEWASTFRASCGGVFFSFFFPRQAEGYNDFLLQSDPHIHITNTFFCFFNGKT